MTSQKVQRMPGGFTLVELLVVIGIIALLLTVLLPVLGAARRRAQSVACASDVRQIYIAMMMFAQDNKGSLPRPYGVGDLSSNPVFLKHFAFLQKVAGASGHVDLDDNKGALWKYVKGKDTRAKLLMCDGDEGEMLAGHPMNPSYPRNLSYSFNSLIERPGSADTAPGLKLDKVLQGSTKIMIYEELAPNDTWCIMGRSPDDVPSGRHAMGMRTDFRNNPNSPDYKSKGRGNFGFFDGHVESLSPGQVLANKKYHVPLIKGDPETY
jgi:prepilin-type N-terminal cleavage/methylation domain-containing protein/prepilin-type processing-associated H-X9-DG protein